ncbi:MAG: hypothetical protein JHC84_14865 [Solirubrobacteraceae bacterium]|nr:hypothetical protein [Solirubrobacteraceae bacterium]
MPPKQRQIRMEQKGALAAMQALETRSDEELEAETKHKAAAQAILGARAAERYDAKAARVHFQKAISAARPQERMQLRRMADASLALAERRAGDLKVAVEKLGQEAPSNRQLFLLKVTGYLVPPPGSSALLRIRGFLLILLIIVAFMAIGFALATVVTLPFGGASAPWRAFIGLFIVTLGFVALYLVGRRRQAKARAARAG